MRPILASALALGLVVVTSIAGAQQPAQDQGQGQGQGQTPPAQDQGQRAQGGGGDMGGYSYSDTPRRTSGGGKKARAYRHTGPVVNLPGFEQTPDGGSRLFVALSQQVPVEEHKAQGSITYVLKGASARVHNNTNALVTVHFNTPVTKARLVPHGKDLHFVIDLRAAATPTWKMTENQDKTAVLQIDFPKGDYVKADGGEAAVSEAGAEQGDQAAEAAAPKKALGKKKSGKGAAPAKPAPAPTGPTP